MTHSHALLHCNNAQLVEARRVAWEGRGPGSLRVFLMSSRWESRLLRFLELSGVGCVVENGEDEEERWAARLDSWETEERVSEASG